jgi:hypothetical protein
MADVSKLIGYAVTGGSDTSAIATKLTAYAITGGSDTKAIVSKMVAYAVVDTTPAPTAKARPQISVIT